MADQLFDDNTQEQQSTQTQQETPTNSPDDLFSDQLKEIKNENGEPKYDSVQKGLDALKHSQDYIPKLEAEKEELFSQLEKTKAELEAMQKVQEIATQQTTQSEGETTNPTSLGEDDINKLVQQALEKERAGNLAESNKEQVQNTLKQTYGDKAPEVINSVAAQHGMSPSELGELSKSKPSLVLALFKEAGATTASPTTTSYSLSASPKKEELEAPEKSLMRGASTKERLEYFQKVKANVYSKYDVN